GLRCRHADLDRRAAGHPDPDLVGKQLLASPAPVHPEQAAVETGSGYGRPRRLAGHQRLAGVSVDAVAAANGFASRAHSCSNESTRCMTRGTAPRSRSNTLCAAAPILRCCCGSRSNLCTWAASWAASATRTAPWCWIRLSVISWKLKVYGPTSTGVDRAA